MEQRRFLLKIRRIPLRRSLIRLLSERRGLHRPGKIRISTRFPFGFFLKSVSFVEVDEDVPVYPRLEQLQAAELRRQAVFLGDFGASKKDEEPKSIASANMRRRRKHSHSLEKHSKIRPVNDP